MRWNSLRAWALVVVAMPGTIPETREDTARLAARLGAVRGRLVMSGPDYRRLQAEYLDWIDARLKAGYTTEAMNAELKAAGLFIAQWGDVADEMDKSHAGYLDEISVKAVRGADDVLVIAAAMYGGAGCSLDVTAVLYDRRSLTRLAAINAVQPDSKDWYWHYLAGLDIGPKDVSGRRLVASGWVVSNCTSNWNGKTIRIDRLNRTSVENILTQGLEARDRYGEETVAPRVQEDVVTFLYDGGTGDLALTSTPAIVRYRVVRDQVIRQAPVALTRAGFIHEWLGMAGSDARRWSAPEAFARHEALASAMEGHVFEWEHIARCGGDPPVWEVAVRLDDRKLYVFRMSGSRATDLRMLAVVDNWTQSCPAEDIRSSLASVGSELPW